MRGVPPKEPDGGGAGAPGAVSVDRDLVSRTSTTCATASTPC